MQNVIDFAKVVQLRIIIALSKMQVILYWEMR